MNDSVASYTALRVAVRRAEHQVLDSRWCLKTGWQSASSIRRVPPRSSPALFLAGRIYTDRFVPSWRYAAVLQRTNLAKAVDDGVRQYVVLGAGLDTFAYRNPHDGVGLRVFEVDHPATESLEAGAITDASIRLPESVTFVPVDLELDGPQEALRRAGFRFDGPGIFLLASAWCLT